jgi:DNA anti-recombination protein RmuC
VHNIEEENLVENLNEQETPQENDKADNTLHRERVAELKQIITEKDTEIAVLKKSVNEFEEQLSNANKSLSAITQRYKTRIIQMHPGITMELIKGDTVEAIDESLEKALDLIGQIKKSVEKESAHNRVPAGAPGRQVVEFSALSAREKIQYAIGGNK